MSTQYTYEDTYEPAVKNKPHNAWHACVEAFDTLVLLSGIVIVMGAIIVMPTHTEQIFGAAVGLLLVEASAWGSTRRLLPGQGQCKAIRAEVDQFLGLVKQLNHAALSIKEHKTPEAQQTFEQTCKAMEQSVKHMIHVAGKTQSDLAKEV